MIMEIPVLSRSAENAEIKHSDIIRSAESLFLQQGFGATSMDRIAEEAKVTKQTVYRYFPSKEALFAAVMQHVRGRKSEPHAFSSAPLIDELIS
ncbi:MAG: helix-turn-helix transcriptional regulator, partial [Rhodospirillaceae bacterium]|nr:helix-turn-helix transcriptional regulator [Rhodospirillaceae bacterium]